MVGDDDIPVLTNVVKRERRAHVALTNDVRQAIVDDISAQVHDMLKQRVQSVAVDIDVLLSSKVIRWVEERLPTLIDDAISARIERTRGDSDADNQS